MAIWRLYYVSIVRDRKGPTIDLQVLINPVVDNTWGGTLQPQGDEFDTERWIATQYVQNPKDQVILMSLQFSLKT